MTFQPPEVSRSVWLILLASGLVLGGLYLADGTTDWGNILAFSAGMGAAFLLANDWAQARFGAESCGIVGKSLLVAVRLPRSPVQTAQFTADYPCTVQTTAEGLMELRSSRQHIVFGHYASRESLPSIAEEVKAMARSLEVLQPEDSVQEASRAD